MSDNKPYFCPDCRSNRVKFKRVFSFSQPFHKNAVTGEVQMMADAEPVPEMEATIECGVCGFVGNELRFVKQAEREPRIETPVISVFQQEI